MSSLLMQVPGVQFPPLGASHKEARRAGGLHTTCDSLFRTLVYTGRNDRPPGHLVDAESQGGPWRRMLTGNQELGCEGELQISFITDGNWIT